MSEGSLTLLCPSCVWFPVTLIKKSFNIHSPVFYPSAVPSLLACYDNLRCWIADKAWDAIMFTFHSVLKWFPNFLLHHSLVLLNFESSFLMALLKFFFRKGTQTVNFLTPWVFEKFCLFHIHEHQFIYFWNSCILCYMYFFLKVMKVCPILFSPLLFFQLTHAFLN